MKQFHRTIFVSFFIFTISLFTLLYFSIFHPILSQNASKYVKYHPSEDSKSKLSVFQTREGVSKDLWISSKDARVHCHIECPRSTLQFIPAKTKSSLLESLTQLKIWIQEPNEVKYLRAETGDYNYSKRSLNTYTSFLSTYKTDNPNSSIFSGIAKEISIIFDDSPVSFTALDFSAHLQTGGSP